MRNLLLILLILLPWSTTAKELDLQLKGIGYRWVQNLESGEYQNSMRLFTQIGITNEVDLRIGWNRNNINNPLNNGTDSIMFEMFKKFE
jgi:hypothetical protein